MREIRLQTLVEEDHTARLRLPDDVRQGPIEVIVRVDEEPIGNGQSVRQFLAKMKASPRPRRTQEEIDRRLREERDSWE